MLPDRDHKSTLMAALCKSGPVVTALTFLLFPTLAFAADPAALLCQVAWAATSNLGAGIATLAIVSVGIAACFGRASWTQALVMAMGVATLGGAIGIAAALIGTGSC